MSLKVEALAGYGLSADEIARVLNIDLPKLRSDYVRELDSGGIKANARVAESLYRQATGDGRQAVTAAIFWLKTRARWKEVHALEHSGPEGGPIDARVHNNTDVAKALLLVLRGENGS